MGSFSWHVVARASCHYLLTSLLWWLRRSPVTDRNSAPAEQVCFPIPRNIQLWVLICAWNWGTAQIPLSKTSFPLLKLPFLEVDPTCSDKSMFQIIGLISFDLDYGSLQYYFQISIFSSSNSQVTSIYLSFHFHQMEVSWNSSCTPTSSILIGIFHSNPCWGTPSPHISAPFHPVSGAVRCCCIRSKQRSASGQLSGRWLLKLMELGLGPRGWIILGSTPW